MSRDRTARTRIRQFLSTSGPVVDPSGYATGVLKDAIGYTGSGVAFIQLIAAMDRDNEITREIRGKRTYRIAGVGVPEMSTANAAPSIDSSVTSVSAPVQPTIELDYKKLAQALVQELLAATASAHAASVEEQTEASVDSARAAAERDDYARRLELARQQIDQLLGEPIGALPADEAVAGRD
jgi:hypothetical protein